MKIFRNVNGKDTQFDLTVDELLDAHIEYERATAVAMATNYIRESVTGDDNTAARAWLLNNADLVANIYIRLAHSKGDVESRLESAVWMALNTAHLPPS